MAWIKRFKPDLAWLIIVGLGTLAAWPLLTRPSLPTFTDGENHVYRTFEIISAWQGGVAYLRWGTDLFYGFGYPVFNYYSPLTYYLAAAYSYFFGPVAGVKMVLVGAAYLGALSMYLLIRHQQRRALAGVVGAAVFSLSPYIVYVEPVARGDMPEALALALAPLLFWAFARLLDKVSPARAGLAALTLAALILTHNLMALLFFGLLLIWLVWELLLRRLGGQPVGRRGPLLLGLGFGIALTTFLWLPAGLERHAINLTEATRGYLDYHGHFVTLSQLLRPVTEHDLDIVATGSSLLYQLGLPQWLLGLGGLVAGLAVPAQRRRLLFFAGLAAVFGFLMTPYSLPIWEHLPWLAYLQFPWRLLGPVMVALAVLAGGAITGWEQWAAARLQLPADRAQPWVTRALAFVRQPAWLAMVGLLACLGCALPLLNPLPWADFGEVSALRLLRAGLEWSPGTTSTNEFLPVTVEAVPGPQADLLQSYERGQVDKINRAALPEGVTADVLAHGPQSDRFSVSSPTAFSLQILTFYFPGWQAYVDGARAPITPAAPHGWITIPVPAGQHEILVRFESTWPRQAGAGITLLAALGLGVYLFLRRRPAAGEPAQPFTLLPWPLALVCLTLLGLVGGFRYLADQHSPWRARPVQAELPPAPYSAYVPLENNLALIAYDLPATARAGETLNLTFYWEAFAPVTRNVGVYVHLWGPAGQLWGQSDNMRPGGFATLPTGRWSLYHWQTDRHQLTLSADLPAGAYTLRVGLWDRYTGQRLRVLDAHGQLTAEDGYTLPHLLQVGP